MTSHHSLWPQRLNLLDRSDPPHALFRRVGFAKVLMHIAVDHISGNDQVEIWHVEHRRVVDIRMPDLDRMENMAFDFKRVWRLHRLGQRDRLRDLVSREELQPSLLKPLRLELLFHVADSSRRGYCFRLRPAFLQRGDAEEVIAVAVRDVDESEVLAWCGIFDPLDEGLRLAD